MPAYCGGREGQRWSPRGRTDGKRARGACAGALPAAGRPVVREPLSRRRAAILGEWPTRISSRWSSARIRPRRPERRPCSASRTSSSRASARFSREVGSAIARMTSGPSSRSITSSWLRCQPHDAIALGCGQGRSPLSQARGQRGVLARGAVGHHDRERHIGILDRHAESLGQLTMVDVQGQVVRQSVQERARSPFVLGHEQLSLGQIDVGDHRGHPVHVRHDQLRSIHQRIGFLGARVPADQAPADLAAQSERPQQILEPDPFVRRERAPTHAADRSHRRPARHRSSPTSTSAPGCAPRPP